MTETSTAQVRRSRIFLIAVIVVCAAPLASAWLLTSGVLDWRPGRYVQHGTLIKPPLRLQQIPADGGNQPGLSVEQFRGHWTLMIFTVESCEINCETRLESLRRVQLALGKNVLNVQRAVFYGQEKQVGAHVERVPQVFPALVRIQAPRPWLDLIGRELRRRGAAANEMSAVVVNPDAEIIMGYGSPLQFAEIHRDLKRLLQAGKPH